MERQAWRGHALGAKDALPGLLQAVQRWHRAYRTLVAPAPQIEKRLILAREAGKKTSKVTAEQASVESQAGKVGRARRRKSVQNHLIIILLMGYLSGYEVGSVPGQLTEKRKDSLTCIAQID